MTNAPAVGAGTGRLRRNLASVIALVLALSSVSVLVIGGSPASAAPNSLSLRATYRANAFVDWPKSALTVSSTATVTNVTHMAVRRLTFNIVPLETGHAVVGGVTVKGTPAKATVQGQSLVVTLPKQLRPGQQTSVTITYRARFNAGNGSNRSLLIKKNGIATAYRWIPWLSRNEPFAVPGFGETWVTAVTPHVTVTLRSNAALTFATTGTPTSTNGRGRTFEAHNVRDFNFSASPDYTVTTVGRHGVKVRIYTHGDAAADRVDAYTKWTLAALAQFGNKLGRYPYSGLSVAQIPAGSGMESPEMTWISSTINRSSVPYIAVHEVAHQWFYGIVGNNQALTPFLDEGLADFLARDLLGAFRPSQCDQDRLDGSVYDYSARCYPEVVYVQSSEYLNKYRDEVGDHDFWVGLRRFYRQHRYEIAGIRSLLDTLDAASGFDSQRHADRFPSLYPRVP